MQKKTEQQRTELKDLGEFGLIHRIQQQFAPQHKESVLGIGDDAAVIDTGADMYTLVATDMLVEGIHFDLSYVPLKHLGYKAVAVNVSDIAAMNGRPKQFTVSLGLSNRFPLEAIDELYAGIKQACSNYNIDLVGGDTTSTRAGLVISITAIGEVAKDEVVYRKGAQENELICVSGDLGGAYMGLQVLEREKQVFMVNPDMQPELDGKDYIVRRQLKPEARTDLVYDMKDVGLKPTSMIDISDGLASELMHLCTQSGVGAILYEEYLPIAKVTYDTSVELNIDPTTSILNGGEDYELLFTVKQSDYDKVKQSAEIIEIGYILPKEKGVVLKTKGEQVIPISAQGWKHF
ncbi:thiamine-phosphate kinase [uncultured Microscilla sp.]|uniref:thiamine-phosphate kinase n=1 Tax=uncultured Microscilla sp. TaxID=432653 RepID=UPI00262CE4C1|nr:thiamine-phosphate kinase [uncultured Microscilla sp.]